MITLPNHYLIIAFHPLFYRKCDQYVLPLETKRDRGAAAFKNRNKSNNPFYSLFFMERHYCKVPTPALPVSREGVRLCQLSRFRFKDKPVRNISDLLGFWNRTTFPLHVIPLPTGGDRGVHIGYNCQLNGFDSTDRL